MSWETPPTSTFIWNFHFLHVVSVMYFNIASPLRHHSGGRVHRWHFLSRLFPVHDSQVSLQNHSSPAKRHHTATESFWFKWKVFLPHIPHGLGFSSFIWRDLWPAVFSIAAGSHRLLTWIWACDEITACFAEGLIKLGARLPQMSCDAHAAGLLYAVFSLGAAADFRK